MIRLLVTLGVAVLASHSAQAQSYCDQVRMAVATYGYEAARKHALANYGKEAVEVADKCLKGRNSAPKPHGLDGQTRSRRG
jgi:hypothetical protein